MLGSGTHGVNTPRIRFSNLGSRMNEVSQSLTLWPLSPQEPRTGMSVTPKQNTLAALEIRQLILRGELKAGERVTEARIAELLGLSRTPIRQALPALAEQGYLEPVGKRGYAVKTFTSEECATALELRAILEGYAARICASKGLSDSAQAAFKACLEEGDALLRSEVVDEAMEQAYGEMNQRFHSLLTESAGKPIVDELVARCSAVPFVSPQMLAFNTTTPSLIKEDLVFAHRQHHSIFEAIMKGEELRVEMLLREHATVQRHSMSL